MLKKIWEVFLTMKKVELVEAVAEEAAETEEAAE